MEFSSILRELREANGLTQKELAKACNLSPQCISALEKGINSPTALTLTAIANYFDIPLDELLEVTPEEHAAGALATRRVNITPIEDDLLHAFRRLGRKHGESTQRGIIDMIEKML